MTNYPVTDDNIKEFRDMKIPAKAAKKRTRARKKIDTSQVCKTVHDNKGEAIRRAIEKTGEYTRVWMG